MCRLKLGCSECRENKDQLNHAEIWKVEVDMSKLLSLERRVGSKSWRPGNDMIDN